METCSGIDWKLTFAALEAELPGTMEECCRIIQNHQTYELLPFPFLVPESYAHYYLEQEGFSIPEGLKDHFDYRRYGQEKIRETGAAETFYGVVINREHPICLDHGERQELKLYSPLTADLYMEPDPDSQEHADGTELLVDLYGEDLTAYKKIILQAIKDEMLPEMEEQGLMFAFSGSGTLSEKVLSLFPTVEEVDGVLCGAAVCQVKGSLTPAELTELKDFCTSQYADSWGEGYAQRPRHTEDGELYVNFWQDNNFSILTKEELETTRTASRPLRQPKRGGEAR